MSYLDATGNRSASFLCPFESALLMSVKLERRANGSSGFPGQGRKVTMDFVFKPSTNIRTAALESSSSNSETIHGRPARESRHVFASYFLQSLAKDTWEGQKIASEVIKHGYGIEYIVFIYNDAQRLRRQLDSLYNTRANFYAKREELAQSIEYKIFKWKLIDGYVDGRHNNLPPFTNIELLMQLLELHPKTDYEKYPSPEVKASDTPKEKWLSAKDILNYIEKHPASASTPPAKEHAGSAPSPGGPL